MEPERDWRGRATLNDLLDRVLDKGLIFHADVIISVAGIPLIGVNLRAALAGMETMVEYGIMQDMDVKARIWEVQHRKTEEEEREICPKCGNSFPVKELLEKGCPKCGWVSARQKMKLKIETY